MGSQNFDLFWPSPVLLPIDPEHAEVLYNSFLARCRSVLGRGRSLLRRSRPEARERPISAASIITSPWPAAVTIPVTHYMSGWRQLLRRRRGSWAGHPSKMNRPLPRPPSYRCLLLVAAASRTAGGAGR